MSLSQRQIDTLIHLLDIELKVLDAYPDEDGPNGRIPNLEACRLELVTLAAADRARRKKTFPGMSWNKDRSWTKTSQPRPVEIPDPPEKAPIATGAGLPQRRADGQ